MVIITKKILSDFGLEHADAIDPLNDWWRIVKTRQWQSFKDIKEDFGSVDLIYGPFSSGTSEHTPTMIKWIAQLFD